MFKFIKQVDLMLVASVVDIEKLFTIGETINVRECALWNLIRFE